VASGDEKTTPQDLAEIAGHARVLAFWSGGGASFVVAPGAAIEIGRSSECRLRVDHPSVSRVHARFVGGDPATVEDLGSSNGSRVGGIAIEAHRPTPVRPGEVIELGSVLVVYQNGRSPAARAAAPFTAGSGAMASVDRLVELVAKSALSVLLLGETGVGKSMTAAALHAGSPRAGRSLVRVDCAAMPENLLEAELFGYERGAFTGAAQAKPGLIEVADGGTIFLDEIAEAPLATQAKLLGCLENREVQRLGSLRPRPIDVRFVAATNRDLDAAVAAGAFRRDLFFRVAGVTIAIPPLRERSGEILALARRFVDDAAKAAGRAAPPAFAPALEAALLAHPWPGNVRELRAAAERAIVFSTPGEPLSVAHFAIGGASSSSSVPSTQPALVASGAARADAAPPSARLHDEVAALERARIEDALARVWLPWQRAAKLLGMSRRALIGRLDAYALPRPRKP
jgi:transcriptional regulator with GAF, ATPase, and Fis domain